MPSAMERIVGFPQDGHPWRIDGCGQISRNLTVPSEPSIELLLSPVDADGVRKYGILSPSAVRSVRQRVCSVNTSYLQYIRPGAVFVDGLRQDAQEWFPASRHFVGFKGLYVSESTARMVPADMLVREKVYLISPYALRLGARGCRGKFLALDYAGKQNHILIPSGVALSFYYFASAAFNRAIIWGRVRDDDNGIFQPETRVYRPDGTAELTLRQQLPDSDAWMAARFAFSKVAQARALAIHNSLSKASANGHPTVPDVLPPFDGLTDLQVCGRWIKSDNEDRFLVFWLVSCSHPFPVSQLVFSRELDGRSDGIDDPSRPEIYVPPSSRRQTRNKFINLRSDTEPQMDAPATLSFLTDRRFPDLIHKPLTKAPKENCSHRSGGPFSDANTKIMDDLSSGAGTYGQSDAGKLDIRVPQDAERDADNKRKRRPSMPPSLGAVRTALDTLQFHGVKYSLITLDPHGDAADGMSVFPTIHGKARWSIVSERRRQVLIAKVTFQKALFYIFEAERLRKNDDYTTLITHRVRFGEIADNEISDILLRCVEKRGVWFKPKEIEDIVPMRVKHTWSTPDDLSATLIRKMQTALPIANPVDHATQSSAA